MASKTVYMKFLFSKTLTICLVAIFTGASLGSCSKDDNKPYEWEWSTDTTAMSEKPRFIWIDAAANFPDFANSKENIMRDLKLAKEAGFTHIVVDVRPTSGDVLFKTDIVNQVKWLGAWLPSGYSKITRTASWDYLQVFIDAADTLGLNVYASINTFVGGKNSSLGSAGVLFREGDKKKWATSLLTETGVRNTLDLSNNSTKFLNPVRDEVQDYICALLHDLASYQGLDGILLDRGRFNNLNSDFSDYTKLKFEEFLGHPVDNFPETVMSADIKAGNLPSDLPQYFKKWLEFRVKVIYEFMQKARNTIKQVNPKIDFGVYVGAWYSTYYNVGVNWASPDYNTAAKFNWATQDYNKYGFADLMDIILIGAYASPNRVYGSGEWSVQGFCTNAKELIGDDAKIVGGIDVGNGSWATSSKGTIKSGIINSINVIMNNCDGFFLFDMIHLKLIEDKWDYVKQGLEKLLK